MNERWRNIWRHSPLVFNHGLRTFILGLGNMVIAVLMIQRTSAEVWGSFVPYLLWMGVGLHIVSWGNKEYLLRSFSKRPKDLSRNFYRVLISRLPLVGIFVLSALFLFPPWLGLALFFWMCFYFFYQSLDSVVTFQQHFGKACIADIVGLFVIILPVLLVPEQLALFPLTMLYALSFLLRVIILSSLIGLPKINFQYQYFELRYFRLAFGFLTISLVGLFSSRIDLYTATVLLEQEQLAQYQIITATLGYVRAAAGIMVYSFISQVYQLSWTAMRHWMYRLIIAGIFISGLGSLGLYVLTGWYLEMELPSRLYFLAIWYCWPAFVITLCVIALFKVQQERVVIYLSLLNLTINLVLSLLLFPKLGLEGGLLAGAVATTLIAILHFILFQRKVFFGNPSRST